jgi:anti-sigma regulatory factor (Ser/Thr protein kinase)
VRVHVAKSETASREARDALSAWLTDVGCSEEITSDALVIVAELVTNAVMHADSDALIVAILDDMRLRIEVHDGDPTPPALAEPTVDGGFGLRIVAALSDSWGWETSGRGKRVWTERLC